MVYGVTIQTLDRCDGNGVTMVFVDASDPPTAEVHAGRIARRRFQCEVVVDDPIECPGFALTREPSSWGQPQYRGYDRSDGDRIVDWHDRVVARDSSALALREGHGTDEHDRRGTRDDVPNVVVSQRDDRRQDQQ